MLRTKLHRLLPIGSLMLAVGLILHNLMHYRSTEFVGGFLIGMSAVFLIAGFFAQSRGVNGLNSMTKRN